MHGVGAGVGWQMPEEMPSELRTVQPVGQLHSHLNSLTPVLGLLKLVPEGQAFLLPGQKQLQPLYTLHFSPMQVWTSPLRHFSLAAHFSESVLESCKSIVCTTPDSFVLENDNA